LVVGGWWLLVATWGTNNQQPPNGHKNRKAEQGNPVQLLVDTVHPTFLGLCDVLKAALI
jgi:hypothetical protein